MPVVPGVYHRRIVAAGFGALRTGHEYFCCLASSTSKQHTKLHVQTRSSFPSAHEKGCIRTKAAAAENWLSMRMSVGHGDPARGPAAEPGVEAVRHCGVAWDIFPERI